jgi:hypothetical protein
MPRAGTGRHETDNRHFVAHKIADSGLNQRRRDDYRIGMRRLCSPYPGSGDNEN